MREANIVSTQWRKHRYKIADHESKIAPHLLNRAFTAKAPKKSSVKYFLSWCTDLLGHYNLVDLKIRKT